jgi:AcrR family transcriptional regulator
MSEQTLPAAASRPLRKDAARNRALLVQAGRKVFGERGLDASLDDVARHAGLGVGTAYRHFANKYELAQAIFTEAIEGIVAKAHEAAAVEDPWQGLLMFFEFAAEAQTTDRGLREVLMGFHDAAEMQRINERIRGPLASIVTRAKQAGLIRPEVEASDIGLVVTMLCTIADLSADVAPDLWRRYVPILLDGLRSGSPLPVPALTDDQFYEAMSRHKQRLIAQAKNPGTCELPKSG